MSTAAAFVAALQKLGSPGRIPMGKIFALAKQHEALAIDEIEALLERDDHAVRVGAVSIMDFAARNKKTPEDRRRALYELYLRRHDRIDTWDLVDRSAPWVVGEWLRTRDRAPLYKLARSKHWYERRTAITATWIYIRNGDVDDTFKLAELLVHDDSEHVHKAVGGWVREAGKHDAKQLRTFLDRHAATMPRVMLRFAIEKLPAAERKKYLGQATPSGAPAATAKKPKTAAKKTTGASAKTKAASAKKKTKQRR